MKQLFILMLLSLSLSSCFVSKKRHYYETLTPVDLHRQPSDKAETFVIIPKHNTLSSTHKLKPAGQYELVKYKEYGGYVRSTGFFFLYTEQNRPSPANSRSELAQNFFGFGGGYSYNDMIRFDFVGRLGKHFYKIGYAEQFGGQKGKRVNEQLSNYGRTVLGTGNFLSAINVGYGREVISRVLIEGEVSFGWRSYYTNYSDRRFNGGGYCLIRSKEFAPGVGLGARYTINNYVNVFAGYNTLMDVTGGIYFTVGF